MGESIVINFLLKLDVMKKIWSILAKLVQLGTLMVSVIHDDFLDTKKDMDTIIYLKEIFNNIVLITLKKKRLWEICVCIRNNEFCTISSFYVCNVQRKN